MSRTQPTPTGGSSPYSLPREEDLVLNLCKEAKIGKEHLKLVVLVFLVIESEVPREE